MNITLRLAFGNYAREITGVIVFNIRLELDLEVGKKAVCLLCSESVAVFKEYNGSRHDATKRAGYGRLWQVFISSGPANKSNRTGQKTCKAAECIRKNQSSPESCYSCQFVVAYNIAKHSISFSDGEFVHKCMLHVADQVCPQQRKKFEEVSLSRRTGVRRIEAIGEDLTSQLKKAGTFISAVFFGIG
ncbi:hypothetical protein C0Q70_21765 [Pomacea canaliculata]|uniref:Uncharacterized protein n=1 Tax=Pomacea canaliculata TaxID=400727 RepID=A0A2T7NAR1_POMCA|nr:hypothetical protein C0Q70_21765 [Pomacea canaliculata]